MLAMLAGNQHVHAAICPIYTLSDDVYNGETTRTSAKTRYPFPNDVRIQDAFYQALCFLVPFLVRLVGTDMTDEKLILHLGTVHGPVLVSL
jgi:hypothetical protein